MARRPAGDAVVVPAIAAGSSVTALRSLGRAGVRTIAVADSASVPALRSAYCDEAYVVPAPDEDLAGYRDALLSLARRSDVVTVVPLREVDIYVLAEYRDRFGAHVATPWPPYENVRRVQDWLRLREVAKDAGVEIPATGPLDEWEAWDRPAVVKSRYSIVERDGRPVTPGMQFVAAGDEPDVEAIRSEMGHVPIVQEYVPGAAECGFFALFDSGTPVATFQHRRIRSYTYSGGASVYRKSIDDPALAAAGTRLLEALEWHGPAMVEFKHDPRTGDYRLIEVNPRFWGSLALSCHAGVDFPSLYYRLAAGESIRPVRTYDVGVGCHLVRGEVSYVHSLLRYEYDVVDRPPIGRELSSILWSFLAQPHFDLLTVDDPLPFVVDVLGAATSTLREGFSTLR